MLSVLSLFFPRWHDARHGHASIIQPRLDHRPTKYLPSPCKLNISDSHQKVHIISSTTIQPSSPTPHRLRALNLSLLDQLFPTPLAHTLLFYTGSCPGESGGGVSLSRRMRASLSETLTEFYPLVGRLRGSACIECNDEGAYWVEARADLRLADVLARPDGTLLAQFLPSSHPETSLLVATGCLLILQVTTFSCGGIAVATCGSHKLMDASSMAFFLRSWSARSVGRLEVGRPWRGGDRGGAG